MKIISRGVDMPFLGSNANSETAFKTDAIPVTVQLLKADPPARRVFYVRKVYLIIPSGDLP